MNTENKDIALLPPPGEATESTDVEIKEENSGEAALSNESPVKDETAEKDKSEEERPFSEEEKGINPLRLMARTGVILLALLAAVVYVVSLLEGVGGLLQTGIDRLALGELFGGSANITALPTPVEQETTDTDLSTTPANEQEDKQNGNIGNQSGEENTNPPAESDSNTKIDGIIGIVSADLSAKGENGLTLINETPYTPALTPNSERAIPPLSELYAEYGDDAPVVLILHTHATESYAESGAEFTSEREYRSLDAEENMLSVGRTLAEVLEAKGINTIFCEELFDGTDFTMAYYNASLKIRKTLEQYPSISYILDLHRDSIAYASGEKTIRPVTEIDGEAMAQMMLVVGTDHGGSGHTEWTDNLNLACRLQSRIHGEHPTLMRPINLRSASFNQQYRKGSLLIEMGAVGSSLEEACRSARTLGEFLAEEIIGATEAILPLSVIQEASDGVPRQDSEA